MIETSVKNKDYMKEKFALFWKLPYPATHFCTLCQEWNLHLVFIESLCSNTKVAHFKPKTSFRRLNAGPFSKVLVILAFLENLQYQDEINYICNHYNCLSEWRSMIYDARKEKK